MATFSGSAARLKKPVAVVLEVAGFGNQNAVGHRLHLFRVAQLDALRAADEVEQQYADPSKVVPGLGGRKRRWGCGRLRLCAQRGRTFEQGRQRGADQRVAQHSAASKA